jgi:hypothetical protein
MTHSSIVEENQNNCRRKNCRTSHLLRSEVHANNRTDATIWFFIPMNFLLSFSLIKLTISIELSVWFYLFKLQLQWKPLNGITLGQRQTDSNN